MNIHVQFGFIFFPQHAGFDLSIVHIDLCYRLYKDEVKKNLESLKTISIKMTILFTVYLYFAVGFFLNKKTEIINVLGVIFF